MGVPKGVDLILSKQGSKTSCKISSKNKSETDKKKPQFSSEHHVNYAEYDVNIYVHLYVSAATNSLLIQ